MRRNAVCIGRLSVSKEVVHILQSFSVFLLIAAVVAAIVLVLLLWDKPAVTIYLQILYCCFMGFLTQQAGLPRAFRFVGDFLSVLLFLQIVLYRPPESLVLIKKPLLTIGVFFIIALLSSFGNLLFGDGDLLFTLWGIRIYIRFFLLFIACVLFLEKQDLESLSRVLLILLPVNLLLCAWQYFGMGLGQDYIGGLFGIEKGSNGDMNQFLLVAASLLVCRYMTGRARLSRSVAGLACVFCIAAISELKALFIEVPVILLISLLVTGPRRRTVVLLAAGSVTMLVSLVVFLSLYPSWGDFFSPGSIIKYLGSSGGYSYGGALNRSTAMPFIFNEALDTWPQKLFGTGIGNAEYFLRFESQFYRTHRQTLYYFFSSAVLLAENGLLGLCAYLSFYIAVAADAVTACRKPQTDGGRMLALVSLHMVFIAFINVFYNTSIRMDSAYLLFFGLSFSYIACKGSTCEEAKQRTTKQSSTP